MEAGFHFPDDAEKQAAALSRLASVLPAYAQALGLSREEIHQQALDAAYFEHVVTVEREMKARAAEWTHWREVVFHGKAADRSGESPDPHPPVSPGVLERFSDLLRQVRASTGYTAEIGEQLGLGPIQPEPTEQDRS